MSDRAAAGKALEFSNRERGRGGDHSINCEAPAGKCPLLKAFERLAQWSDFVWKRRFRNLVGIELTRQGVARQPPLGRIGQRFAPAVDDTTNWLDEALTLGGARS